MPMEKSLRYSQKGSVTIIIIIIIIIINNNSNNNNNNNNNNITTIILWNLGASASSNKVSLD